ncbi:hypothetical protein DVU_2054 [Nitratidesulfovibrio vulgaris str. Hildenborough]|uniref:Uncharacterized protein n=1 Tax=Nitratidesulfovibrio vulgaris (strain ATCC 29579 / DSM 644 / CCUG 34227 / NCIMB 8303 / VKM B-1760 / Hildenborough) TaxID=882 RepID=Q72AE3_NITV2|nr:hypothetical protein DVU_2054 [Nitratidesulfovibrio vulgaris str. Hildenborough]
MDCRFCSFPEKMPYATGASVGDAVWLSRLFFY